MTARLEAHGDVKLRVQQAPYQWHYPTARPNWADAKEDRRRYLVTAGTQVWLADAADEEAAVRACDLGIGFATDYLYGRRACDPSGLIDSGEVRVREATDADEARLVAILEAERAAKQLPLPAQRVKPRKVNKPGSGIKPQPIPDLGAARRARARRKAVAA